MSCIGLGIELPVGASGVAGVRAPRLAAAALTFV
jgi:hypothetical protein